LSKRTFEWCLWPVSEHDDYKRCLGGESKIKLNRKLDTAYNQQNALLCAITADNIINMPCLEMSIPIHPLHSNTIRPCSRTASPTIIPLHHQPPSAPAPHTTLPHHPPVPTSTAHSLLHPPASTPREPLHHCNINKYEFIKINKFKYHERGSYCGATSSLQSIRHISLPKF